MRFPRRRFLQLVAGGAAFSAAPGLASAATRPIRLVLPFPPGGAFDIIGRPWADKVNRTLGTVIVVNQPGAGGSVAAAAVAHSQPDGYTIFLASSVPAPRMPNVRFTHKSGHCQLKQFDYIGRERSLSNDKPVTTFSEIEP